MAKALVIGASGGIGSVMSAALRARRVDVVTLSRREDEFNITDEASVSEAFSKLERPFDLVLVATGALEIYGAAPEKSLRNLDPKAMMEQFSLNTIGPAMVLKHIAPHLPRDRRAVVAVLSARVGSIGDNKLGGWYSYRAAKAAVNQVVRTASIEYARTHKHLICIALHPGTVATKFTEKYLGRHPAVAPSAAADNLLAVIDQLSPTQTGGFFDYSGAEVPW